MKLARMLALCVAGMIGFSPGLASALVFQDGFNGYFGTQDTELRDNDLTGNFGSNPTLTIDENDRGSVTHGLLRFDDIIGNDPGNKIPLGATIAFATLRLFVTSRGNDIDMWQILLKDWTQDTATWITPFGAGVLNDPNDTALLRTLEGLPVVDSLLSKSGKFIKIDVTTEVQNWANGANNFGVAFTPTGNDGVDFATSENPNESRRPKLYVSIVPEPGTLAIFGLGLAGLGYIRRRRAF